MRRFGTQGRLYPEDNYLQAGKKQLAAYIQLEDAVAGYSIVFDHRQNPEPRVETKTVNGVKIRSYVIPVMQERPSQA